MNNKLNYFKKNRRLYNGFLLVIFTAILFFIALHRIETNKLKLEIGDFAPMNIRATKDLEDIYTKEKLQVEAIARVQPRYRILASVQMTMKNQIKDFLDNVRDIKAYENMTFNKKVEELTKNQNLGLEEEDVQVAIRMDYKSLNNLENNLMDLINQIMGKGIRESDLDYEKENLKETFQSLDLNNNEKQLGLSLLLKTIEENEFLDKVETERLKNEAANRVEDVIIKENEIIAPINSRIGEREMDLMIESGLLREDKRIPLLMIFGIILLLVIGISIVIGYIFIANRQVLRNNHLLIILLIILTTIIISKEMYILSPYIMPVATAALLISILIDPKLALIVNIFIVVYLGFILKLDENIMAMYLMSASIASLLALRQEQRHKILLNGAIVGIINILVLAAYNFAKGLGTLPSFSYLVYVFVNGLIAAILTLGTLPIWENVFSVLTTLKLLELSNPNQPLLKALLLEAPGTYHHSILVGNLAEAAAEAVSANSLLARVGSYYHDIGKATRPYYFAENQFGMENPHDKLQPMQSTEVIVSHTLDGIRMAREAKLPMEIIDIIDQHHGDTAVAYFYYKSKEENPGMDISMDKFRYKGTRPQTKEAAIVMLADSTEAAVRSIKGLTKEKIEDMVRKVVDGKVKDNQLNQCNITLKEIEIVINSFIKVLTGIYHDRIEYPDMEEKGEV